MQMSSDLGGPLADFIASIGGNSFGSNGVTPVQYMLDTCRLDSRWIVAHLNYVSDRDLELLARNSKCNVVHCPRSHAFFGHSPFMFEELRDLGLNICLGTDSLASNVDLNLFAEMRAFQRSWPGVSPEEILSMITVNAAAALGKPDMLGQIRQNFMADLVAIPFGGSFEDLFESLIAHEGPVSFSIIAGKTAKL
jgi:cytosine/adenosine deaminase-related metal-dependent hydrolase